MSCPRSAGLEASHQPGEMLVLPKPAGELPLSLAGQLSAFAGQAREELCLPSPLLWLSMSACWPCEVTAPVQCSACRTLPPTPPALSRMGREVGKAGFWPLQQAGLAGSAATAAVM